MLLKQGKLYSFIPRCLSKC